MGDGLLAIFVLTGLPTHRLAVFSRPPTSDSQLQTEVEDAVRDECPQGGDDDSDEEEDEQQRLPDVTAAALLGGRAAITAAGAGSAGAASGSGSDSG